MPEVASAVPVCYKNRSRRFWTNVSNMATSFDPPRWAVSTVSVIARSDAHVDRILSEALSLVGTTRLEHVRLPGSISVFFADANIAEAFADWAMDWDLERLEEDWAAELAKDGLTAKDLFDAVNTQPWARND